MPMCEERQVSVSRVSSAVDFVGKEFQPRNMGTYHRCKPRRDSGLEIRRASGTQNPLHYTQSSMGETEDAIIYAKNETFSGRYSGL